LRTDRITPGPLWLQGWPNFRPVVFTSRSLRSGMGLSEPLASSSCDDSTFCSRKFSFAACSGLQATPGPSGGSEPPGRHAPLPGLTRYRLVSLLRGLYGPGFGADFHGLRRFRHRRFQPRGSPSSDVSLMTLLPLALACVIRRPARSAGYPCPIQAGTVPPGRLHSSTGLPYLIGSPDLSRHVRCAPSGLLRGLPGVRFGRTFLPTTDLRLLFGFLSRSLSTSRFLRSGMGLSEPHFPVASDRQSLVGCRREKALRKFSFAAGLRSVSYP